MLAVGRMLHFQTFYPFANQSGLIIWCSIRTVMLWLWISSSSSSRWQRAAKLSVVPPTCFQMWGSYSRQRDAGQSWSEDFPIITRGKSYSHTGNKPHPDLTAQGDQRGRPHTPPRAAPYGTPPSTHAHCQPTEGAATARAGAAPGSCAPRQVLGCRGLNRSMPVACVWWGLPVYLWGFGSQVGAKPGCMPGLHRNSSSLIPQSGRCSWVQSCCCLGS